jgi:hypothetical protein
MFLKNSEISENSEKFRKIQKNSEKFRKIQKFQKYFRNRNISDVSKILVLKKNHTFYNLKKFVTFCK